jgi:hypothetical protein
LLSLLAAAPASAQEGGALAEPAAIGLRTDVLEELLAADASSAAEGRTWSAAISIVIGVVGLGSAPVLFALDDGTGILPIASLLGVQLGAIGLTSGILEAGWPSLEERRYARWSELRAERPLRASDLARYEGRLLADAERASVGRSFVIAQGIATMVSGLYTGIVGLFVSRIEEIQILMGTVGGVELALGLLQLISGLDPTDTERRPAEYEIRTGVRITWNGTSLRGAF